jgi:hypothetical protein
MSLFLPRFFYCHILCAGLDLQTSVQLLEKVGVPDGIVGILLGHLLRLLAVEVLDALHQVDQQLITRL